MRPGQRNRRITTDQYDKKVDEYRRKQNEIRTKIDGLHHADEDYYITAKYLLELANRAAELFESSEMHQKRQILGLVLQNLKLKGRKLQYDLKKPFDTILDCKRRNEWLRR